jgi:hypothetical protein
VRTATIQFYECEHDGDLDTYIEDLTNSGFSVSGATVNEDAEIGTCTIEAPEEEWATCVAKFKETDSFGFLN